MLAEFGLTSLLFLQFCLADRLLSRYTSLDGIYYLLHSVHNGAIVYLTFDEVVNSLTDYSYIQTSQKNILALQLVFALHFYHIAIYWRKFRFDDWLHHILMIGIALPLGTYVDSKALLGYSLFFTTGLPGGIDYFLLFLTRNGWLFKGYEKQINSWLNVWVRSPGCISHATLSILYMSSQEQVYSLDWFLAMIIASLIFWNGQYFMRQIVENYTVEKIKY